MFVFAVPNSRIEKIVYNKLANVQMSHKSKNNEWPTDHVLIQL